MFWMHCRYTVSLGPGGEVTYFVQVQASLLSLGDTDPK